MKAKLNTRYLPNGDIEYTIKAGEKGTGKDLFRCTSWDNPRATEQVEEWVSRFVRSHDVELTNDIEDGLY